MVEQSQDHTPYQVHLGDLFDGPMDLLVHLVKKNEVDIYDIPIALITQQYIEYLEWMKSVNIDVAGEFLVMAATLAHIKSRTLLPAQEEEGEGEPVPEYAGQTHISLQCLSNPQHGNTLSSGPGGEAISAWRGRSWAQIEGARKLRAPVHSLQ